MGYMDRSPNITGKKGGSQFALTAEVNVSGMEGKEHKSFAENASKDSELLVAQECSSAQKRSENISGT